METVLIVEDEVTTRDALSELLGKDGRQIVTADNGQEAMERLTRVPRPRVILLDLVMPKWMAGNFCGVTQPIHRWPIFLPSYCPAPSCQQEQSTS